MDLRGSRITSTSPVFCMYFKTHKGHLSRPDPQCRETTVYWEGYEEVVLAKIHGGRKQSYCDDYFMEILRVGKDARCHI